MATFKAIVIDKAEAGQTVRLADFDEKDLMDGDVTVAVEYSTLNYKDGLAPVSYTHLDVYKRQRKGGDD